MGLIERIKAKLRKSKSESEFMEVHEEEISIIDNQTPYGKKLNLSPSEKSKLVETLTPRERETFFLLLEGYSLKETAKYLDIKYSTANTYQTAIYKKLHVNSRAELIINYRDVGEKGKH